MEHTYHSKSAGKYQKNYSTTNSGHIKMKTRTGKVFIFFCINLVFLSNCPMERQRTFQTIYGTDGHCFEVGTSLETNMKDLKRADALSSLLDNKKIKLKSKQKRAEPMNMHIKRRRLRCFERVRNRVRDLHHKVSS